MRLGSWRGAPITVHWTVPVATLAVTSFTWAPGMWIAFIALLAVHVAGHAYCGRRFGASIRAYDVNGVGGGCRWDGDLSTRQALWLAWGGLSAQVFAGVFVWGLSGVFAGPNDHAVAQGLELWLRVNLVLIGLNLLPLPGCDGLDAWRLVATLRARMLARERSAPSARDSDLPAGLEDEDWVLQDPAAAEVAREIQEALERIADAVRAETESESESQPSPEEEHS